MMSTHPTQNAIVAPSRSQHGIAARSPSAPRDGGVELLEADRAGRLFRGGRGVRAVVGGDVGC